MSTGKRITVGQMIVWAFVPVCILMLSGLKGMANYISAIIVFAVFAVCFAETLRMKDIGYSANVYKSTLCFVLFMVFYVLSSLPELDAEYCLKYTMDFCISFAPLVVCHKAVRDCSKKQLRVFLWAIMALWVIMCIISIRFYIVNPQAARTEASDGDAFSGEVFGGYMLSYGSALLCNYLFMTLLYRKPGVIKGILTAAVCVMLAVLVYMTQSMLTFVAMLAGLAATVFFDTNRSINHRYLKLLISAIVLAGGVLLMQHVIQNNISAIMAWLDGHNEYLMLRRVKSLLQNYFFNFQTRHFSERTGLVKASFELFTESPIFGHGYKYGNVFSAGKAYGIGNHSELLDSLARYGLTGALPLFGIYYFSAKEYMKKHPGILVCFFMLVMFNPFITFASNLVLMLIIPVSEHLNIKTERD